MTDMDGWTHDTETTPVARVRPLHIKGEPQLSVTAAATFPVGQASQLGGYAVISLRCNPPFWNMVGIPHWRALLRQVAMYFVPFVNVIPALSFSIHCTSNDRPELSELAPCTHAVRVRRPCCVSPK
jgi:hypothetical protein